MRKQAGWKLRTKCLGGEKVTTPRYPRIYDGLNIFFFVIFVIQLKALIMVDECKSSADATKLTN